MGHHAQYRKRGTSTMDGQLTLPPPSPSEWSMRAHLSTLEGKRFVAFPGSAADMMVEFSSNTFSWETGYSFNTLNTWETVASDLTPGRYYVRVAWSTGDPTYQRLSPWSVAKYDDIS